MADLPTLFADGVVEATVRHGVARLKLAVQDGKGTPVPTGLLVVPLTQLPAVAGALTRLLREVEAKARETQPGQAAPEPAEPPAAFRFQG
ncbi:hypothetical protein SAMN02745194_02599 [Roseomonas rosea]|uniref:Uncharacterized protein n=1 Tax=Muricoccus roseus TaxID=198092 RepID=A0A1M6JFC2_9PROT|nr:hypothetical protein [Roseomonas rosea]SHJ45335.1 hypothetical protein SAMN02745194_02599 [Roseomonas rosea]